MKANGKRINANKLMIKLLIILILATFGLVSPVFAQTFSSQFGIELSDISPGANSSINIVINQPQADEPGFKRIMVTVPAGFEFTASDQLGQDEKVGQGTFFAGPLPAGVYNTNVSILNDQTVSGVQRVHWKLVFDDGSIPQIDIFITGDSTTGHTFVIEFPPEISLPTPIFWPLEIFGASPLSGTPIVRNPTTGGIYTWKGEFQLIGENIYTKQVEGLIGQRQQEKITEQPVVKQESKKEMRKENAGQSLLGEKDQKVATQSRKEVPVATESTNSPISGSENKISKFLPLAIVSGVLGSLILLGILRFKLKFGKRKTDLKI